MYEGGKVSSNDVVLIVVLNEAAGFIIRITKILCLGMEVEPPQ